MRGTIVCLERYRSEVTKAGARPPAELAPPASPFCGYDGGPARPLSDRQLAHRRRMLEHLSRRSRAAS